MIPSTKQQTTGTKWDAISTMMPATDQHHIPNTFVQHLPMMVSLSVPPISWVKLFAQTLQTLCQTDVEYLGNISTVLIRLHRMMVTNHTHWSRIRQDHFVLKEL